ncbi:MAG: ABC transporter permease subunit [Ignavibacteria bacterium]|nr:ABC transporter permease subunit [Ignavibacteria bacterium]MBL0322415.1 ABC transporter permease subunit [Ignavibacteria bacterium]
MIGTAYRVEMSKVFSKWRTFIGFIALGVLIPVVVAAMGIEGGQYLGFATQALKQTFDFTGNLMNGYTVSYIIFGSLYVHVPFLITLVAGEVLAGEATAGTYRLLLTRPLSRSTMVSAKFLATLTYTNLLVLFMAVMSLGLGIALLGTGEVVVIRSQITIIAENDLWWRFTLAYGFAALAMTTVASVAFLFSSLVENAIGPIMTTMAIIIVMTIISAIDIPIFDYLRPLFFTNHMNGWKFLFDDPVNWTKVSISAGVLLTHIIGCYTATQIIMRRKDILT